MYVSGGIGFLNDLLDVAGATSVFGDVRRESVQPSQETVLTRAPQVIVELRPKPLTTAQVAAERRAWSPLASVPAVRNSTIHFLTGDYYFVPGPRVAIAAEGLARTLHPEAFR
jgi:iron complex transport system substrate-binding protein